MRKQPAGDYDPICRRWGRCTTCLFIPGRTRFVARGWALVLVCLAGMTLTACGSYQLRGTVIHGDVPAVLVVDRDDPRLSQHGLSDVTLDFTLDPERMSPRRLGSEVTDQIGRFVKPVDAAGAGFLEYDLGILARGAGLRDVWHILPMPGANKRLLIIMAEGRSGSGSGSGGSRGSGGAGDLLDETLRLKEQLMDR